MSGFEGAGTKAGIEVWRIENKEPAAVPTKMYGHFYEGDAYICLKTTQKSSGFEWDLFFWLGKDSEQAEQGIAAYKTVELDEQLGGAPVQSREVQGYESDKFMQCFKSVQYLKGGVASGFKHVVRDVYETRLLQLKGARMVRVSVVPLAAASLNAGDVFILDEGLKITQWNGSEANRKEKAKALDVCVGIKDDERGGKAKVTAIEQGSEPPEFWTALGGKGPVQAAIADTRERQGSTVEKRGEAKLIKVSDSSGSLSMADVASGSLARDMLDTNDVFVMDNGADIFVWIGKGATDAERRSGMKLGTDYCTQAARPAGTRVTKVMEGAEPTLFKSNFATWNAPASRKSFTVRSGGNVAKAAQGKSATELVSSLSGAIDAHESAEERELAAMMGAQEGGTTEVWRIEGFEAVAVDPSLYGRFYAGDSYIVQYSFLSGSKQEYVLYFWLGKESTADEKGAAALITTRKDDMLGGAATQVRVQMGKEPLHFVKLFKGQMVVHSGGKASAFKNKADADSYDTDGISLFHVRGSNEIDTRAVQVAEAASSLNSGDCFVLMTPSTIYAWKGNGANAAEGATAAEIAERLKGPRTVETVEEGSEPAAFWAALGGKGEYPSTRVLAEGSREPMLFSCSNSTGTLALEPIFDYAQSDLEDGDVYILDSFTTIWVWVGSEANDVEKKGAAEAATAYIAAKGYDASTSVVTVKSGAEPPIFTCHFLGWDSSKASVFVDPYEAKLKAALAANPVDISEPEPPPSQPVGGAALKSASFSDPAGGSYEFNYEELKKPADQLPSSVDPTKREQYLSDADFEKVLGSPRGVFNALKPWKQNQLKKAAGLF